MEKNQFNYGFCLLVLVLLCSLLSGCLNSPKAESNPQDQESGIESNQQQSSSEMNSDRDAENDSDGSVDHISDSHADNSSNEMSSEMNETVQEEDTEWKEITTVKFEVEPGMYLTEILTSLVDAGWGDSVDAVLDQVEQLDRESFQWWNEIQNVEERAFAAEGYIAPGVYEWKADAAVEEVLASLLGSWDTLLTAELQYQAEIQGYTLDEILIMASIVEWESSFDPNNVVKPQVAAVVRNRIESETPLQMDVTIFYLQDSLEPYRDPQQYEMYYDTYMRDGLPAGPIGSPSMDSIWAVLTPADTADLFFVYDEEGNYYFAEDYEQHLKNCELAGIY